MSTQPQTYESIPALTGRPPPARRASVNRRGPTAEPEETPTLPEHARRDAVMVGVCIVAYIACLGFALNIIFGTLT